VPLPPLHSRRHCNAQLEAGERRFEVDDLKFGGSFMRRPSLLVTAGEYDFYRTVYRFDIATGASSQGLSTQRSYPDP
jgi:hypothetical protein